MLCRSSEGGGEGEERGESVQGFDGAPTTTRHDHGLLLTYGETVTGCDEYKSQVEQPGRHLPMLCAPILLGEGTAARGRGRGGEGKLAGF